jgi:GTP pyrophosphokinase
MRVGSWTPPSSKPSDPEALLPYTEKFDRALLHAANLHRDQTRKGTGVPYVTHLLAVASIVGENNGTEDEVIAALLHDAPEDAGGEAQLAEIRTRFGDGVADIVAGCTDTYEDRNRPGTPARRLTSAPRRGPLLRASRLRGGQAPQRPLRIVGLPAVGENLWDRFNGGRDGTLWYYRAVADALAGDGQVADELGRVVAELERAAGGR